MVCSLKIALNSHFESDWCATLTIRSRQNKARKYTPPSIYFHEMDARADVVMYALDAGVLSYIQSLGTDPVVDPVSKIAEDGEISPPGSRSPTNSARSTVYHSESSPIDNAIDSQPLIRKRSLPSDDPPSVSSPLGPVPLSVAGNDIRGIVNGASHNSVYAPDIIKPEGSVTGSDYIPSLAQEDLSDASDSKERRSPPRVIHRLPTRTVSQRTSDGYIPSDTAATQRRIMERTGGTTSYLPNERSLPNSSSLPPRPFTDTTSARRPPQGTRYPNDGRYLDPTYSYPPDPRYSDRSPYPNGPDYREYRDDKRQIPFYNSGWNHYPSRKDGSYPGPSNHPQKRQREDPYENGSFQRAETVKRLNSNSELDGTLRL